MDIFVYVTSTGVQNESPSFPEQWWIHKSLLCRLRILYQSWDTSTSHYSSQKTYCVLLVLNVRAFLMRLFENMLFSHFKRMFTIDLLNVLLWQVVDFVHWTMIILSFYICQHFTDLKAWCCCLDQYELHSPKSNKTMIYRSLDHRFIFHMLRNLNWDSPELLHLFKYAANDPGSLYSLPLLACWI